MLSPYPWQSAEWQRLTNLVSSQRLPHALLLDGVEGIGLEHFARSAAMKLLCLDTQPDGSACGLCQSCQLFAAGNHPDFSEVTPEETGKQIKIDQIREVIDYVSLKSFTNKVKIVVITPADAMNRATANALLKTLEEPPEQAMMILLSHYAERLPITIRSRCQHISFSPASVDTSLAWIKQQHGDIDAELMLHLSQGGPLLIENMLEQDVHSQRKRILKDLTMMQDKAIDAVQLASEWQGIGCQEILRWLMRFVQDMVTLKLAQRNENLPIINIDLKAELLSLAQVSELKLLMRNYDYLMLKYQQANAPMNYNLLSILEEIVVNWNNPELQIA